MEIEERKNRTKNLENKKKAVSIVVEQLTFLHFLVLFFVFVVVVVVFSLT